MRYRTKFKDLNEALKFGLGGWLTESNFENWEFELIRICDDIGDAWGRTHLGVFDDGVELAYPENFVEKVNCVFLVAVAHIDCMQDITLYKCEEKSATKAWDKVNDTLEDNWRVITVLEESEVEQIK